MNQMSNRSANKTALVAHGLSLNDFIAQKNKDEVLNLLQQHNFGPKDTDCLNNTVLHLLIKNENLMENEETELIELFLDGGADPNVDNLSGESPLHLAVLKRRKGIIDLLIRYNANVDRRDQNDDTIPILFIRNEYYNFFRNFNSDSVSISAEAESESASFVKWLISRGFDFDYQNYLNDISAIYLTIEYNLQHILPVLFEYTNDINHINSNGDSLLLHFFLRDTTDCLNKLFKDRYFSRIVKILVERGVCTEFIGKRTELTALQRAIEQDRDMSVIHMLANHFPNIENQSSVATMYFYKIMYVCKSWSDSKIQAYLEILRDLITKGADVNYQDESMNYTPLYWAVNAGNLRAVEFLQANGANFQAKTRDRRNLLYLLIDKYYNEAIYFSDEFQSTLIKLLELLLNEGCKVDVIDENGLSPLHLAARLENVSIALKLIELGLDVKCTNANMMTPLHYSAATIVRSSVNDVAELLLNRGANVNAKNRWGKTPLHIAAARWDFHSRTTNKRLITLLEWGAIVNVLDESGKSALYVALENRRLANAQELLKWGANIDDVLESSTADLISRSFVLLYHCVKLKIANLPCSDLYKDCLYLVQPGLDEFKESCLKEIVSLKGTFIKDDVSIFTFLHMTAESRCAYMNSEKLLSIINSSSFKETFPEYSTLILAKFREAAAWKKLLEPAKLAWLDLTEIHLPDLCLERIFAYFSNMELFNLIEGDNNRQRYEKNLAADHSNTLVYEKYF